jgi:hypothetical protein
MPNPIECFRNITKYKPYVLNIDNLSVYFGDMDNRVTDVNVHCHLGLDLQRNCKWGDYVSKIYKKACFYIGSQPSSLYNLDLDEFTLNPVIILPAST